MLEKLFTSSTRVRLLHAFFANPEKELYVRELTRITGDQINSVRRELENLKKIGLLRSRARVRKLFYHINTDFVFVRELQSMFAKEGSNHSEIARRLNGLGKVHLIVLSGLFIDHTKSPIDLFVVGDILNTKLQKYIAVLENSFESDIKYVQISLKDFRYRWECNDQFIRALVKDSRNIVAVKKIEF